MKPLREREIVTGTAPYTVRFSDPRGIIDLRWTGTVDTVRTIEGVDAWRWQHTDDAKFHARHMCEEPVDGVTLTFDIPGLVSETQRIDRVHPQDTLSVTLHPLPPDTPRRGMSERAMRFTTW